MDLQVIDFSSHNLPILQTDKCKMVNLPNKLLKQVNPTLQSIVFSFM
jgi:hypothetical protein